MAAAKITTYTIKEITGNEYEEIVDCTTVTTGDWYISTKFTVIDNVQCTGIGHAAFPASITNGKIVITCTGGDHVHLRIIGH